MRSGEAGLALLLSSGGPRRQRLRCPVGLLARFGQVFGKVVKLPLSGLRVAHRSAVIDRVLHKLLILLDE